MRFIRVFQHIISYGINSTLTSACGIEKRTESSSGVCGGGDVTVVLSLEVRRGYHPQKNNIDCEKNNKNVQTISKGGGLSEEVYGNKNRIKFRDCPQLTLGRSSLSPSVCILLISERFNHFLPYNTYCTIIL